MTPAQVGWWRRGRTVLVALLLAVSLMACTTGGGRPDPPAEQLRPLTVPPSRDRALSQLGDPPSGGRWFSGIWAGGDVASTTRVEQFGVFRGTPVDAVTTYPAYETWQQIHDSDWHIATYDGFDGVLVYGLPMLPSHDAGSLTTIAAGDHDWVYRQVAKDLVAHGRGRSIVRIGWEANGGWFPWNTTASTAAVYRAAFRHIVSVLRSEAPNLVVDFDIGCGTKLRGQTDRLDSLNLLYPGDDAVDLVGCDTYDWSTTTAVDEATWATSQKPPNAAGIADVAEFARARGKGLTYPEWGLASRADNGAGDNPFYVQKMRQFFEANADVLVLESYFSEPQGSLANSIWDPDQNPSSSRVYVDLW